MYFQYFPLLALTQYAKFAASPPEFWKKLKRVLNRIFPQPVKRREMSWKDLIKQCVIR